MYGTLFVIHIAEYWMNDPTYLFARKRLMIFDIVANAFAVAAFMLTVSITGSNPFPRESIAPYIRLAWLGDLIFLAPTTVYKMYSILCFYFADMRKDATKNSHRH
jgi:hypothetical protein